MLNCDVCVTGAGIIGLSIALELNRRGARVIVIERGNALSEASQAAAGMLAANDPENPPQIARLSQHSITHYPDFLRQIEAVSGMPVPFQTTLTLQAVEHKPAPQPPFPHPFTSANGHFIHLEEHSIDPRQLAPALYAAVKATNIQLLEDAPAQSVQESNDGVTVITPSVGIHAGRLVQSSGAWSPAPVTPRKGQMLAVTMPPGHEIDFVLRTPTIYAVPRLTGPRAGQVVIGATVEEAGFSRGTDPVSLATLRAMAAQFLPALADTSRAPQVDQWSGLRPSTPDQLPILGFATPRTVFATGHYRNGILLAPATASVVADLLEDQTPAVDLAPFSPTRFFAR